VNPSFALAIPHAPWIPERAENMRRLSREPGLTCFEDDFCTWTKIFDEKAPWPERSVRRWEWAISTGATHFVQLEDDVVVAPHFWRSLAAMVRAWPEDTICLASTHSMAPMVVAQGRRSYFTPRLIGWGCAWPMPRTAAILAHAKEGHLAAFASRPGKPCEDTFLAEFFVQRGIPIRHPCPTIVDHLHMVSTNGEDFDLHTNTQASVTWRGYAAEDMAEPEWWRTPTTWLQPEWTREEAALMGVCQWCGERPTVLRSEVTCMGICNRCTFRIIAQALGVEGTIRIIDPVTKKP
jgi:hypothetical protein